MPLQQYVTRNEANTNLSYNNFLTLLKINKSIDFLLKIKLCLKHSLVQFFLNVIKIFHNITR
jgi:hypothetical protein